MLVSTAAFGLCWGRHSRRFPKVLTPSLFPLLTSFWLLYFPKTLALRLPGWLSYSCSDCQDCRSQGLGTVFPWRAMLFSPISLSFLPRVMLISAQILPSQRACGWWLFLNSNHPLPTTFSLTLPCLTFPHNIYHHLTCIGLSVILLPLLEFLTPWEWLSVLVTAIFPCLSHCMQSGNFEWLSESIRTEEHVVPPIHHWF